MARIQSQNGNLIQILLEVYRFPTHLTFFFFIFRFQEVQMVLVFVKKQQRNYVFSLSDSFYVILMRWSIIEDDRKSNGNNGTSGCGAEGNNGTSG